jgi:glucose/mannose transport system substrate-binding protein
LNKTALYVTVAVIITALVVGGGIWYITRPTAAADVLEIYHWWTSGGEKDAIDALVDVFKAKYPDTGVIQSPVAGGAGYVMKAVMKSLVLAGEAPDAFQMHAGYEGQPYFAGGYLDPISDLWEEEGWKGVIPDVVEDMVKFEGEYYAVPVNIHRPNVVWYNKHVLDANGIDPATLTTWGAFFNACVTLVEDPEIDSPIALGDKGKWTDTHVLEQIIAGEGIDFYEDWINGEVTSATDSKLLDALETFKTYLGYVNADHAALTWDEAITKVIRGESAFSVMGDWANGEFFKVDKVYGTDYGTFPCPGTAGMYGLVIDCFQHPKGVKHSENSLNWLRVVGSKEGQDTFNPLKGSIACRTDADITKYGPYQKAALTDFTAATSMYPSVAHGSGAPEAFTAELDDIMSDFVESRDVSAAASALTAATNAASADYTRVWDLS